jgi:hypothetical protein
MSPGSVFASTICGAVIITAPTNVMNTKHNAGTDTHPGDFTFAMIAAPAPKPQRNPSKHRRFNPHSSPTTPRRINQSRLLTFVSDRLPTDYTIIPPTATTHLLAAIYNSADELLYLLIMHGANLLPGSKLLPPRPPPPYEP